LSTTAKVAAALAVLGIVALGVWQWEWDVSFLEGWLEQRPYGGALIYVSLFAASVVLLPLSSLPLLPLAARSHGVWITALLSTAGWWIGCLIAFAIARLGRQYLERITSFEAVDRVEKKIPADVGFGGIVILRMILPVDIVSFALGLLKQLRFSTYAAASLIGIIPFAVVWSVAGGELGQGRVWSFLLVLAGMTAVILLLRRWWK
jgi:uncharacterized membrane protein YdjX (TVP38/TMEM64 family)